MTDDELQAEAREILRRSIALGRLPAKPDPAALARTAALIVQVTRNQIAGGDNPRRSVKPETSTPEPLTRSSGRGQA